MSGVAPDPLDRASDAIRDAMDAGGDFLNEPVGKAGIAALDALVEVARAAREIRDTAKWYADNDARLAQEVDHALCVEVYALADNALARLEGAA